MGLGLLRWEGAEPFRQQPRRQEALSQVPQPSHLNPAFLQLLWFPAEPTSPLQAQTALTLWQAPAPLHIGVTHVTGGTPVGKNKDQFCQVSRNPEPHRELGSKKFSQQPVCGEEAQGPGETWAERGPDTGPR